MYFANNADWSEHNRKPCKEHLLDFRENRNEESVSVGGSSSTTRTPNMIAIPGIVPNTIGGGCFVLMAMLKSILDPADVKPDPVAFPPGEHSGVGDIWTVTVASACACACGPEIANTSTNSCMEATLNTSKWSQAILKVLVSCFPNNPVNC